MKFHIEQKKAVNERDGDWHKTFIIWPRRTSEDAVSFLEYVERRYIPVSCSQVLCDDGCYRWEYRSIKNGQETIWKSPVVHDL